ncbi:hypothetical protein [Pseudomonas mangrovi]|uniref:hypothetical protein n=1 Tax=Pseudomonas mangrovi TaxID=2161748 RepID=UPI0011B208CF|nr:hypothetical protein [Pseudomonas mangrovi]
MNNNDDKYGVLLFPQAIEELGKAIESYLHDGSVGKYIYCKQLTHLPGFVALTITPEQVNNRIGSEMTIHIPSHFVKFIAYGKNLDHQKIGFIQ